jgi:hypothetical protein
MRQAVTVTGDEPYPLRELEAIAAGSKPWLSSPAVPSTCPKQQSTTVASDEYELGGSRLGRWPILAWAPGEDGPNLRRTTPKNPVRVAGGRTRLLPADAPLGVISAPRNSRSRSESRSRESRPTARGPLEPHRRNGGLFLPTAQRFAVRTRRPIWQELQPGFPVQPRRPLGATFYDRSPGGGRQGDVSTGQTHMPSS